MALPLSNWEKLKLALRLSYSGTVMTVFQIVQVTDICVPESSPRSHLYITIYTYYQA